MNFPIEKQVCSLDLSKRLERFGVIQESLFWWHDTDNPVDSHRDWYVSDKKEYDTDPAFESVFSAFTVAEILEMLPEQVNGFDLRIEKQITEKNGIYWYVAYWECGYEDETRFNTYSEHSLADAATKMLIYLLEHNLISPEQLK